MSTNIQSGSLVSVCIPTYNSEAFIAEALSSVFSQSLENIEVIVCDDVSTDQTLKVCRRFKDPRLRIFSQTKHIGLFRNFNRAMSYASGQYIKFLASDDWLEPTALEKLTNALQSNPQAAMAVCAAKVISQKDGILMSMLAPFEESGLIAADEIMRQFALNLNNDFADVTTALFRRREGEPGFAAGYCFYDMEYWCRLLSQGDYYYIAEPLANIRRHEPNTSEGLALSLAALIDIPKLEAHFREYALSQGSTPEDWTTIVQRKLEAYRNEWFLPGTAYTYEDQARQAIINAAQELPLLIGEDLMPQLIENLVLLNFLSWQGVTQHNLGHQRAKQSLSPLTPALESLKSSRLDVKDSQADQTNVIVPGNVEPVSTG